jgi:hypothetical protein
MRIAHPSRFPVSVGPALLTMALALATVCAAPRAARADRPDTLRFEPIEPVPQDLEEQERQPLRPGASARGWLDVPFHENLLEDRHRGPFRRDPLAFDVALDYNRVDELRLGLTSQVQGPSVFSPRLASRIEYSTGRRRWLYGAQLEQPLDPGNRFALGVSMARVTDHLDLNQVEDFENSLALLFGRQDYRDYFEREGVDAYAAARWPSVTTLSAHVRNDRYRSLAALDVRSWLHRDRSLRPNPEIAEGDVHAVVVRLERHPRRIGGLYHWIEFENAGGRLGGDFEYRRALADVRSVIRLAPAVTVRLRAVGGSTLGGTLPPQRTFTIGGVDGLRAHSFGAFRGDQAALGQAEYTVGFGHLRHRDVDGIHAIVFADAGNAWNDSDHRWDVDRQRFDLDGGFGVGTADDGLRIYFARDLRDPGSDFVISARLQRPF